MREVNPRWDAKNRRWECSIGSGKTRRWFRCKIEGEEGRQIAQAKRDRALNGPDPLQPGTLAEFIETVWWPRTKARATKATLDGYASILGREISVFYDSPLESLTLERLQPWVSDMNGSPKTVQNVYRVLSSILELARLTGRYARTDHKLVVLPEVGERMTCPKCKVELEPGIALQPTPVPDFIGDSEGCTVSGLDNKLIDCLKCPECGWSVTR